MAYECSHIGISALYACDLAGVCYLDKNRIFMMQRISENEEEVSFNGFRIKALEALPRPDQAIILAVESIPEQDYRGVRQMLVGPIPFFALILGILRLVRARKSSL